MSIPYRDWASHVVSCALVSATKRRETLLLETARSPTPAGSGSSARRYLRVVTPIVDRFQRAGVERIAAGGVGEAGKFELVAVDTPRAQARHEDAAAPERDLPADTAAAVGAARGVGDVLRPAEPRALLFHQRAQHLLTGVETETEERRARVGEDVEEGQRQLHRDDGRGRERFPGGRSCATLLHGGSFRNGCGDRRPTMDGERSRRSFFSPSVQQTPGHPLFTKAQRTTEGSSLTLVKRVYDYVRFIQNTTGCDVVERQGALDDGKVVS